MDTEYYFELITRISIVKLHELNHTVDRVRTLFTSFNVRDADEKYFNTDAYSQTTRSNQFGPDDYGQIWVKDITVSPND